MDLKKEERYYQPDVLNRWFGISSLLFLASIVAMFGNDYIREWKGHQREFRQIDIVMTRRNLETAAVDAALRGELESKQEQAEEQLATHQQQLDELAGLIELAKGEHYWASMRYQGSVADLGAERYQLEHALAEGEHAENLEEQYASRSAQTQAYKLEAEQFQIEIDGYETEVKQLKTDTKAASDELAELLQDVSLLERKLRLIDRESMSTANKIADRIRNLPVIDFMAPSIKIGQIIVNDIQDDVNFAVVPKVDRCTSCHLGIDKVGFEDAPSPYTTHPNLDLFISSGSAHPMIEFGCTSCHNGRGRGTSFVSSGHMPSSPEQAEEWREKYDWEPLVYWEEKMFPARYSEAGCLKCHANEPMIGGAEKLTLGLTLMEKASCYGCHQIDRFEDWGQRGPNLSVVSNKLTTEFAFKWIRNPRSFRHNTWMPGFFGQTNNSSPEDVHRTNTEIHAMVAYLFDKSETVQMPLRARQGNATRGKELFDALGCRGCHVVELEPLAVETDLDRMFQRHGPNLIGLGSKVTDAWVYNWIKDPTFYNPDSRMPNLRLSDREAGDITAYLRSMRNIAFEDIAVPALDEEELDRIAARWLSKNAAEADARAQVAGMSLGERLEFVGRRSILHYGCFSCHNIPGFEDAKPIGTPLTLEGSKPTHNLDFGSVHEIGHTNFEWFEAKLTNPRIFDRDMVKPYDEKLRMPNFYFTPTQAEAVTTALLGLVKSNVHPDKMSDRKMEPQIINRGMAVIKDYNCQGCHIINGRGGQIVQVIGDPAMSPPNLNTEGAKVHPDWLYSFFKAPTTIRPNLTVRMPTFPLTDNQWNDIIRSFQFRDGGTITFERDHTFATGGASLAAGEFLASADMGACSKCHIMDGKNPTGDTADWAPDLALARERLRPQWIVEWLRDPNAMMPGTRMPQPYIPSREDVDFEGAEEIFPRTVIRIAGDDEALLGALRDYIYSIGN